jgi:predicted PurR-regulated permease PerM
MTTKAVLLLLLMTSAIYFLRFSPQIYEKTSSSLRNLENTEAMTILCGTSDNSSWYNIYQNQTEGRILEFLQTIHPQNQVINYINSGQANSSNLTQIALTYGETVAPYAAVGLGAALLTFIFCFFYCFDCVCFKPCFDQDKCTQRFCSFIAIFLVIAMGGISIAGIVMGFFIPENV